MKSYLSINILIFIFLLTCQTCFAQVPDYVPFPKDTAIWGHVKYGFQPSPILMHHRLTIQMGDTIFHGKKYKKLYTRELSVDWGQDTSWAGFLDRVFGSSGTGSPYLYDRVTYRGAYREEIDAKKVYYRFKTQTAEDTTEYLFFDFSAQIGDTVDFNCYVPAIGLKIDEKKAILKSYIPFKNTGTYCFDFKALKGFFPSWIMGIGGQLGFVFEGSCKPESGSDSYLLCFNDLSPGCIKYNAEDCPLVKYVGRYISISNSKISLTPNPVLKDEIVQLLGFTPSQWVSVYIYNQYGQLVDQKREMANMSGKLYIQQSLSSGVYLLQIVNQNQEFYNEKLLIY